MTSHRVRISVIVPAYNVEKYIGAALDSLLRQTFSDFEAIVIDDGSTDGTVGMVETYDDKRISLVRHGRNQGLAAARNTGFRRAQGEFIALLDADDIALPTRLAEQVAALDADPTLGMVGAYVVVMNENGESRNVVWTRPVAPEDVAIGMLFRNTVFASMAVRKTAVPEEIYRMLPMAEDYDFNMRVARRCRIGNIGKPLTRYRVRAGALTQTKKELMEQCVRGVMLEQIRELGFEPTPYELDLNRHVGALTLPNSPQLLDEIEAWLMKLRDANAKAGRYPEAAFMRNIAAEWFEVCKFASSLGDRAFRVWRQSPLRHHWQPPNRELWKFMVKCLVRHSRPGGDIASMA